jgi:hypothetical protein
MVDASVKTDIAFVENRSPLDGRPAQHLAHTAVTYLGIDRVRADPEGDWRGGGILNDGALTLRA